MCTQITVGSLNLKDERSLNADGHVDEEFILGELWQALILVTSLYVVGNFQTPARSHSSPVQPAG